MKPSCEIKSGKYELVIGDYVVPKEEDKAKLTSHLVQVGNSRAIARYTCCKPNLDKIKEPSW